MSKILPFSATRSEPLVSPVELCKEYPANITQIDFIEQSRQQITQILDGTDNRLLLIMGPCSIHDIKACEHYAKKIKELSHVISDVFFPIMRFYFEKPRTALGWKGIMHDPHLDGSFDLNTGLRLTRKLLLKLADLKVPAASEILDPISGQFFGDLLSWGCIGARTSSSQLHRQVASGLPMPVAFKNNTDGNVDVAIHGILTASNPHAFIGINEKGLASIIHTDGNPNCHLVLRGSEKSPNYDSESVKHALESLQRAKLSSKLIIDCSHDNSRRDHTKQPEVFENGIDQILSGNSSIIGFILESHLHAGNQQITSNPEMLKYAISLTDSCMDWEATEGIILSARKSILSKRSPPEQSKNSSTMESESQEFALL